MHARTRILAASGIAAAAVFTLVGVVGAANASPLDASASAQPTRHVVVDAWSDVIPATRTVNLPRLTCPDDARYLQNAAYSPGRIVIPGVEVIESGGVGVTIPNVYVAGASPYVRGAEGSGASATNWSPFSKAAVLVKLHCTSDPAESYTGAH